MSRNARYARARTWKPYRAERSAKTEVPPPEGELWIVDETLTEIERIDPKVVDKNRAK